MQEGLFHIRRKAMVPSIYRIYLNADDYEPFRDVVPFIAGEIRSALDERLARLNGSKRHLAKGLLEKIGVGEAAGEALGATEYVRASDAWTVEIYPDLDGKLQRGEIEVYSDLGAPQKAEYGAGSLTRRIFPKGAEVATEAPPALVEPAVAAEPPDNAPTVAADSAPTVAADSAPTVATLRAPATSDAKEIGAEKENDDDGTKGRAFAYIRYADQQGPKTFEVTKSQMVIGRGGRSYWVDLKLETLPDVSREHCRIRRDAETGRFTIEDVSQFGTAVNGKPVGQNATAELPRRATISLAGVLDLQWEAV
jgi:predicted component of type VI protein secretion system